MSMYDFFVSALGTPEGSDIAVWCLCAFCVFYAVIDLIHLLFSAIFSWIKK